MGSTPAVAEKEKPHLVFVPYPAQGHVTPMLKLAKLLHPMGFHITFVNTEYNHRRLLNSRGPHALDGLPDFRFETIPDGLPPPSDQAADGTQDIPALCLSTMTKCRAPFKRLLARLSGGASGVPPVTYVVSDGVMSFTLDAAEELGIPEVLFWTPSACGVLGYMHYKDLVQRGLVPLKDSSYSSSNRGSLETRVEGIPGLNGIRLKDFPSFVRTTNPDDIMLNFMLHETSRASRASGVILNTFDDFERSALDALSSMLPPIYTIGPLAKQEVPKISRPAMSSMGSNLWKEDAACLEWLDLEGREPNSVVYVNYGSITVMSSHQLVEFAWGLCNSGRDFLWVIRPDLVRGDSAVLPEEFLEKTRGRSLLASWCDQERLLAHPAVGGFLTHCGWNSTLESVCAGVPMLCWPFFAEQQTNCWYACNVWGVGMEIDSDVRREDVERLIGELMGGGDKGREMRKRAQEWKDRAVAATGRGGSSRVNLEKLVTDVLQSR